MRAGAVSTAAQLAVALQRPWRPARHCPEAEYLAFMDGQDIHPGYRAAKLRHYRVFMQRWPNMTEWFAAPLVERVGRLPGEPHTEPSYPVSFRARPYLLFLALRGHVAFDYPWMLGAGQLRVIDPAAEMGIDLRTGTLIEEAIALGYAAGSARQAMNWTVSRIALHAGLSRAEDITEEHITAALEGVRLFSEREDLHRFYPSAQSYRDNASKQWVTHLHQLQVVLFHRGQVAVQPRKLMPSWKPAMDLPPRMLAVAQKWLAARKLTDAPSTVDKLELAVRVFGVWLGENHPQITTFAHVTREHCLDWIGHIAQAPTERTGKPLGVMSRIQRISGLSQFFRDTAVWQYADVPGHTLIGAGDAPKYPQKVPRFIPDHELDKLMPPSRHSTARSSAPPCWWPAGPGRAAPRSSVCRSTAWTGTPTAPRGCDCPAARPTANASSPCTKTPQQPFRPSSTCARTRPSDPSPTSAPERRSATSS